MKADTVALPVTVPAETKRAAAQIAREHAGRKLETVLAALVADMAVALGRSEGVMSHLLP